MTPPPPPATAVAGDVAFERARPVTREAVKNIPVKVWAGFGGVVFLFEAYVITRWVSGPYFTPVHIGASRIPTWMKFSLHIQEAVFFLIFAAVAWHFIIKPFRREGRFSTDGLLSIAIMVFAWFQDPIANYSGAIFTYNSGLLNMGSWINDVPGAVTQGRPGAMISEGFWDMMIYPGVLFLCAVLGTAFMRKLKERRPQTTPLGLIASVYAFMIFIDFIMEAVILMPLGGYTYAGAPNWSSINVGHYYKYTFLEGLTFGGTMACWAAFRYFKDDHGRTIAERGIDRLKVSRAQDTGLRFLAIGAFVSLSMFVCTTVPWNWMALHQSTWPKDVQKRTYFTQGLCGAATTFACDGPSVPIPRSNSSVHLAPNGTLVVPPGQHLPRLVPLDH
jgi:Spirocyclase AveC-like